MPDLAARARTLLDLHAAPEILVLPNVWDVVSAKVVAAAPGVRALATASHSVAAAFGYPDGEQIPLDLHLEQIKRIVAVGGQKVGIADAVLEVDGRAVAEPYVDRATIDGVYFGPVMVPVGSVFVMGDNREFSIDSRTFGPIPTEAIDGRLVTTLWSACSPD